MLLYKACDGGKYANPWKPFPGNGTPPRSGHKSYYGGTVVLPLGGGFRIPPAARRVDYGTSRNGPRPKDQSRVIRKIANRALDGGNKDRRVENRRVSVALASVSVVS